ncbi:uncharacterized protein MELLADRAFT_109174 [Melampsora larici-populina 98AG31]|uniref:Uncharacterized protein n=1 Tax=Melampsora larici-populina (strain 98AG31 / pathotype 3-4-7) TaxID=747676 RepID=F4RVK2_MELLP|nr:uncharacterized protein MELLADRAFT_109174 [Melampsora larici-populina 98AG31]EGG03635.1 hypothetical protein MELLADRAFT_109174 [Melampsora larici-populina 98AG31]
MNLIVLVEFGLIQARFEDSRGCAFRGWLECGWPFDSIWIDNGFRDVRDLGNRFDSWDCIGTVTLVGTGPVAAPGSEPGQGGPGFKSSLMQTWVPVLVKADRVKERTWVQTLQCEVLGSSLHGDMEKAGSGSFQGDLPGTMSVLNMEFYDCDTRVFLVWWRVIAHFVTSSMFFKVIYLALVLNTEFYDCDIRVFSVWWRAIAHAGTCFSVGVRGVIIVFLIRVDMVYPLITSGGACKDDGWQFQFTWPGFGPWLMIYDE